MQHLKLVLTIQKIQSLHSNELTHRKRFDEGLIERWKSKSNKKTLQEAGTMIKKTRS